jgi:hypothetical protein
VMRDAIASSTFCFLVYGVWPNLGIFECTYTSLTTLTNYGAWILMEFRFCQPIEFDTSTSLICFEHFSKWLELVPLLNYNNERASYAFLDKVLSRFGLLAKVFIDQSMKICGKFQELCESSLINHCTTSQYHHEVDELAKWMV